MCAFSIGEISTDDVIKYLKVLGQRSSIDVLGFDSKLLHMAWDCLAPFLVCLFNWSLKLGYVHEDWKLARVSPVYKCEGSTDNPANYRPISVVEACCKSICQLSST